MLTTLRIYDHHITQKCNFFAKRLNLLGYYIDEKGVHTDPEMIQGIQDWLTRKSKIELQCLNGVIIYHAQYLPHLATVMTPLTDLISENGFE
jgi:hypothetical protein